VTSSLPQFNSSPDAGSSEVCPNCGNFTDEKGLSDVTGWCADCTDRTVSVRTNTSEQTLATHADAIQHFIRTEGVSVWRAVELARQDRPRCVVCGEVMKRAVRKAIFCRRHPLCRTWSRRYVYLYTQRHNESRSVSNGANRTNGRGMKVVELRAYESVSTRMIHLVGTFPSPRTAGTSQCGQKLVGMRFLSQPLSEVPTESICRKCLQLLGIL
jgi:hypothetical protein